MAKQDNNKEQQGEQASQSKSKNLANILKFEKWISSLGAHSASDLHLTVGNVPMIRTGGKIEPLLEEDVITGEQNQAIVEHLLSEGELLELSKKREIIVSRTLKRIMRFRIHIFYSRGFPSISMRYIQPISLMVEELALPKIVSEAVLAQQGLFIIAGPFDSGKTSTAVSMINSINHKQSKYIVTIESPVEHIIPSDKSIVAQREVGHDVNSYSEGLEAILGEDVNVVFVGSLFEENIIDIILRLASSGKLCVVCAQSRNVVGVISQMRDIVSEKDRERILGLLSDSLLGIICQVLVPKVGGGRFLISEVMRNIAPIKSLIRDNKINQIPNIMQTSRGEGMIILDKSLADAVKSGKITLQDAQEYAIDKIQFNVLVSH